MAELLQRAGVAPGRVVRPATASPERSSVPAGEVRVLPPPVPRGYRPSAGEVALARAYVACADRTGFAGTVDRAVGAALARVDATYADRAERLTGELRAELHRLAGP